MSVLLAVAQMCSGSDRPANLNQARSLVCAAAEHGAQVVCLPEMWPFVGSDADKIAGAEALDGPSVTAMRELAAQHGLWLFPGSFAEQSAVPGRVHNTAVAIDPSGKLVGIYRKIHLFDVDIPGGATFVESDTVTPGDRLIVVQTPWAKIGLSICYDLRFPALYQSLQEQGAQVLLVPAAFTAHTGKDHWEVLLRARAIEQQCYVIAANHGGWHNSQRQSHGHSMAVDPWGLVIARASDGPGLALAEIDATRVAEVRSQLPCTTHRRPLQ